MNNGGGRRQREVEVVEGADDKAFIWKLPHIKLKETGKIGPAFGLGAGCGVGFGFSVVGGMGIGPGNPGFQMGFGLAAGCGVGFGFGYGLEGVLLMMSIGCILMLGNWLIHNVCLLRIDEFVINTKKLARATLKEIDKWRR